MKIGFDIGGVLSKYPQEFFNIIDSLLKDDNKIFIITDMHPKDKVCTILIENGFFETYSSAGLKQSTKTEYYNSYYKGVIHPDNIYSADYDKYGNMAKAILIKELGIEMFFDDFDGYLQWDSSLGPQPILLKVIPDAFKPYWHKTWICDGDDFGRRTYKKD